MAKLNCITQMLLSVGDKLGPYEILAPIGAGGMGEVYRARDARLGRNVALKILTEEVSRDPHRVARFEREARAASALNHPNIVSVYDVGREGGVSYIVTELVEGESLRHAIAQGPMPARTAIDIGTQIAEGLAAAHAAGIVHRDLKPENVMLSRDRRVKILDFGLAWQASLATGDRQETEPTATALTNPGVVLGTIGYMSPEQVRAQVADTRADIFSAGAVVYEMLAGKRAFTGASSVEIMNAILKEEPPDLQAPILPSLDRIVRRCLEKEPARRFQSAADLGFALQAISGTSWPPPAGIKPNAMAQLRWLVLGAFFFLIAAILAAWTWIQARQQVSQPFYTPVITSEGNVGSAYFYGELPLYGFTPLDGKKHIYIADTAGGTREISIPPGSDIASVSGRGELALLTSAGDEGGSLLRLSLAGGAPRQVLDHVSCAHWSPDGAELAIVRRVAGRHRLEYPIGHALFESTDPLFSCRISPDGDTVAFVAHDAGKSSRWFLFLAKRSGKVTQLARIADRELTAQPLLWRPDGREIWYSSFQPNERGTLYGLSLTGANRVVARFPGDITLADISPSGRALLHEATSFKRVLLHRDGASPADLSWMATDSFGISDDGSAVALFEFGTKHEFFVRFLRDPVPVRFENGSLSMDSLSPDGKLLAISRDKEGVPQTVYVPTGPGEEYVLRVEGVENPTHAGWFHDSTRFLFSGRRNGSDVWFVGTVGGGELRLLSGSAQPASGSSWLQIAPDGERYCTLEPDGKWRVRQFSGTPPKPIPQLSEADFVFAWTADSKAVFVEATGSGDTRIDRVDAVTGIRTLWREDAGPKGMQKTWLPMITPDGKARVYTYGHGVSSLWTAEGLK